MLDRVHYFNKIKTRSTLLACLQSSVHIRSGRALLQAARKIFKKFTKKIRIIIVIFIVDGFDAHSLDEPRH